MGTVTSRIARERGLASGDILDDLLRLVGAADDGHVQVRGAASGQRPVRLREVRVPPPLHVDLGYIYRRQGRMEEAAASLRTALERSPSATVGSGLPRNGWWPVIIS